jgi:hypothetical protein
MKFRTIQLKELFTKKPPKIPSKISWQIEFAIRTAYATAICFVLVYYFQWGALTTISPVFSAMSTTMYFGIWQRTYWIVLSSSITAATAGAFVGLTWEYPSIQILLIFWIVLWIGKCSVWSPAAKTWGGIVFILCALSPTTSQGTVSTYEIVLGVLLTTNIPFLLTGLTLLFPYPRFSHNQCQQSLELLSDRFSRILCDYVDAYCNSEESDLFLSVAKSHILEAKKLLQLITELSLNIDTESYLFPLLTKYSENLVQLLPILKKILDELTAMGTILPDILRNETHKMHIKVMKTTLRQTALQFRTVLMIMTIAHMKQLIPSNFCFLPIGNDWYRIEITCYHNSFEFFQAIWQTLCSIYQSARAFILCKPRQPKPPPPSQGIHPGFLDAIDSLIAYEQTLLSSTQCARDDYVFIRPPGSVMQTEPLEDDADGLVCSPMHSTSAFSKQGETKDSKPITLRTGSSYSLSPLQIYERSMYQTQKNLDAKPLSPSLDAPLSTFLPLSKSLTIDETSEVSVSLSVKELEMMATPRSFEPLSSIPPPPSPKRSRSLSFSEHPPTILSMPSISESQDGSSSDKMASDDIESAIKKYKASQDGDTDSLVSWRYTHMRHPSIYEDTVVDQETGMNTNYATILYFENLRYGTHNWSPRLSFLATLLSLMDIVGEMKHLNNNSFQEHKVPASSSWLDYLKSFITSNVSRFQYNYPVLSELLTSFVFTFQYLYSCLFEPYRVAVMLSHLLSVYLCCCYSTNQEIDSSSSQRITEYRHYLHHYIHPTKIAIITVICSLFVVLPFFQKIFPFGLWGVVVATLIRQENSSSSFSRGFQRIEGTVLGCIYAYMISLLFQCEIQSCYTPPVVFLVVLWLALCAYFREGMQRGYAAIVAGFTPIIVLLGSSHGSQAGAWARVQMTVIGVTVYLIVDNTILPSRADVALRKNVINSISHITKLLTATSLALDGLFCLANPEGISVSNSAELFPSDEMPPLESISPGGFILAEYDADDEEVSNYLSNHVSKNMKHLDSANSELTLLTALVSDQSSLLQLAALEPELWHRYSKQISSLDISQALSVGRISISSSLHGACGIVLSISLYCDPISPPLGSTGSLPS